MSSQRNTLRAMAALVCAGGLASRGLEGRAFVAPGPLRQLAPGPGGSPMGPEAPRLSAAEGTEAGSVGGSWAATTAGLMLAGAAIGSSRRQARDVGLAASGNKRRPAINQWYYSTEGSEGGPPKEPTFLDPKADDYGMWGDEKFEVPKWFTIEKWRTSFVARERSRELYWFLKFWDKEGKEAFDKKKNYGVSEALDIVLDMTTRGPREGDKFVVAKMTMNLDPRKPDEQLRTTVSLPHGTGQGLRVAVFCEEAETEEALSLGAVCAGDALMQKITDDDIDFDVLIAKPAMMPKLARLGKILGPRKLMPSPKSGTVVQEYGAAIEEFSKGASAEVRLDEKSMIILQFGTVAMGKAKLEENFRAFINQLVDKAPPGAPSNYFKKVNVVTTLAPFLVSLDVNELPKAVSNRD